MFSTQKKKKRMFTFTENFDDLQKSFKICSYKTVVYVEIQGSTNYVSKLFLFPRVRMIENSPNKF